MADGEVEGDGDLQFLGEVAEGFLHGFALGIDAAEWDFLGAGLVFEHQGVLVGAIFEIA